MYSFAKRGIYQIHKWAEFTGIPMSDHSGQWVPSTCHGRKKRGDPRSSRQELTNSS